MTSRPLSRLRLHLKHRLGQIGRTVSGFNRATFVREFSSLVEFWVADYRWEAKFLDWASFGVRAEAIFLSTEAWEGSIIALSWLSIGSERSHLTSKVSALAHKGPLWLETLPPDFELDWRILTRLRCLTHSPSHLSCRLNCHCLFEIYVYSKLSVIHFIPILYFL